MSAHLKARLEPEYSPAADIARELERTRLENRRRFVEVLGRYDGAKETFSEIIANAIIYQGLSQGNLASLCETTPATISRWARGAAPSYLARRAAVERIRMLLEHRLPACDGSEDARGDDDAGPPRAGLAIV